MNKERITELADAIEEHVVNPEDRLTRFSMTRHCNTAFRPADAAIATITSQVYCMTPCCVAGWTVHLFGERDELFDRTVWVGRVADLLELSDWDADKLIHPKHKPWPDISKADAVRCLRALADTGEVKWGDDA